MNGISPQLQNQIAQYQQVQQQLQNVTTQKVQMQAQQKELQRTIVELDKAAGDVYKNVGVLLIKVDDKAALKADLEESLETLGVRLTSIDRQEKDLRDRYAVLQQTISAAMGTASAQQPAASAVSPARVAAQQAAARRAPVKKKPVKDDDEEDE